MLELLVTTVILAIVMGAATGVLLAQNTTFMRQSGTREAREQALLALDKLEESIRMAGFGIDPQLAFDFDFYNCKLGNSAGNITQSTKCQNLTRDSATDADELVLYYRNPSYNTNATTGCPGATNLLGNAWRVVSASATAPSVTLTLHPNDFIHRGRVLQIVCQDATTYAYVTVSAPATSNACGDVSVNLETTITVNGPSGAVLSPYSRADLLNASCFNSGQARAFLVDRSHFFIHQDTTNPVRPRPYLMLDSGLDLAGPGGTPPDGVLDDNDLLPVASDIEDFQVAYGLDQVGILQSGAALAANQPAYIFDNNNNGIWGDTPGVVEQLTGNPAATAPYNLASSFTAANAVIGVGTGGAPCFNSALVPYRLPCLFDKATLEVSRVNVHPYRWTAWTGNITEVRINIVSRSTQSVAKTTDLSSRSVDIRYLSPLENRARVDLASAAGWYGNTNAVSFVHSYFSGAVRPVNVASSGIFLY